MDRSMMHRCVMNRGMMDWCVMNRGVMHRCVMNRGMMDWCVMYWGMVNRNGMYWGRMNGFWWMIRSWGMMNWGSIFRFTRILDIGNIPRIIISYIISYGLFSSIGKKYMILTIGCITIPMFFLTKM